MRTADSRAARAGATVAAPIELKSKDSPVRRRQVLPSPAFETLQEELGKGFIGTALLSSAANPNGRKPPHSVFTSELIDAAG